MKKSAEEGLDKVFKQGLSTPMPHFTEFRESDWDAFEQMLDKRDRKRAGIFWLPFISGIAALLALGFGWLYLQSNHTQPKQQVAVHHTQTVIGKTGALTRLNPVTSPKGDNAAVKQDNAGKSGGGQQQNAGALSNNQPVANGGRYIASAHRGNNGKSFLSLSAPVTRRHIAGLTGDEQNNNKPDSRPGVKTLAVLSLTDIPDATPANTVNNNIPKLQLNPVGSNNKTATVLSPRKRPQLALTVLAAPDINGVGSFNNAQVGTNVGLLFSVTLSKFKFSTGVAYSKKPYMTDFYNYHTQYKFYTDPQTVSADCHVLDIPINIDYTVYGNAKNQISVGSGISSYIMLREQYNYNYANTGIYTYGPSSYTVSNQNKHYFGVLNFDATYQHRLNSKFSIDVQPYLKMPLTNIGYGQVRLQSAGVALGLSWNLNSLSKP